MTKEQKGVATFGPLALLTTLVSLYATAHFNEALTRSGWALSAPIATLIISVWLLISIGTIGNKRFLHEDSIGGSVVDVPGGRLTVDKAVLQNTLEQLILAAIVYQALAHLYGSAALPYTATLTALFSLGRLCFLLGYKGGAGSRAFGFGLTFYPTVLTFLYIVVRSVV